MQPPNESPRAEDVIAFAAQLWGAACTRCAIDLLGQEAVLSLLLGLRDRPQCFACLADAHGAERDAFLVRAVRNVSRLDCYRAGWEYSDARLAGAGPWPEERLPHDLRLACASLERTMDEPEDASEAQPAFAEAAHRYDAGDIGCGELVLALRARFAPLPAGATLHLTATDIGAPEDLPAWCRLTGHRLVRAEHPEYLIARRTD